MKKSYKMKTKLDLHRMLKEILAMVETDFAFDMDCKSLPKAKPYTQKEAREMANIIGTIYSIAHCLNCQACQTKYLLK